MLQKSLATADTLAAYCFSIKDADGSITKQWRAIARSASDNMGGLLRVED
jgi:hypothetical protein